MLKLVVDELKEIITKLQSVTTLLEKMAEDDEE